ncbi:LOW QUALITY PROTEIN: hypothetical protein KUTeg_023170 [Tegillarca granosa]|uniref:Sulfotransferase domain-containing protein n=1 Tax=Tegillarca granosa TaxID=220873 RepID=A0ABQ9E6M4_TEGGR|nr:LOW QUALITY PROTEIN: hypothetical protein KUTeg_023170 [Tegillarca granosa]
MTFNLKSRLIIRVDIISRHENILVTLIIRILMGEKKILKYKHPEELIKQIAENVDFKNQSKKKYDFTKQFSIDKKPFIYRKGQIGDWKTMFTVTQNEVFDDLYEKEMKDSKLRITFNK